MIDAQFVDRPLPYLLAMDRPNLSRHGDVISDTAATRFVDFLEEHSVELDA